MAKRHSGSIDLLLTDIIMPRMNGKQLAQEFAKIRPKTATIYMSGFSEREWGEAGTPEHAAAFLPKPFRNSVLLAKVHEVLATRDSVA